MGVRGREGQGAWGSGGARVRGRGGQGARGSGGARIRGNENQGERESGGVAVGGREGQGGQTATGRLNFKKRRGGGLASTDGPQAARSKLQPNPKSARPRWRAYTERSLCAIRGAHKKHSRCPKLRPGTTFIRHARLLCRRQRGPYRVQDEEYHCKREAQRCAAFLLPNPTR